MASFTKETQQGYSIVGKLEKNDKTHIIAKRENDYMVGLYYDETDGTWGSGKYGYKTTDEAFAELIKHLF